MFVDIFSTVLLVLFTGIFGSAICEETVEAPPKAPNAWTAAEGFYPKFPKAWRSVLASQVERTKKGNIDVIFIGDSLTQGWDKTIWKERYEPLNAVNYGVGGDGTPQVLWRIEHGILDGLKPKLVVLMIGINNTWPGFKALDTIKGTEAVVNAIKSKCPETKILLLGVLPIFDKQDGVRQMIKEINAGIAKLDDGKQIRFLDFGNKMLEEDGSRKKDLYVADRLHLTPAAYQIWADAMAQLLKEMLGGN